MQRTFSDGRPLTTCERGYHDRPRGADCCVECGEPVTRAGREAVAQREQATAERVARHEAAEQVRAGGK